MWSVKAVGMWCVNGPAYVLYRTSVPNKASHVGCQLSSARQTIKDSRQEQALH